MGSMAESSSTRRSSSLPPPPPGAPSMDGRQNRREALMTLLAAGTATVAAPVWAQGLDLAAEPALDLRVLFYNTHLLPSIAQSIAGKRGQDDYRTTAIAAQLHRYDL